MDMLSDKSKIPFVIFLTKMIKTEFINVSINFYFFISCVL